MKKIISIILVMMMSLTLFACGSKIDTAVANADEFIIELNEEAELYHLESEYDAENSVYNIILSVDLEKYIQTNYPKLEGSVQAERLADMYVTIFDNDTETIATVLATVRSEIVQYFEGLEVSVATYHVDAAGEYHQYQ